MRLSVCNKLSDLVVWPQKDIHVAQQFYIDGLGFEKVFENGNPVGFMVLKQGACELHLTFALFTLCQNTEARIIKRLQDKGEEGTIYDLAMANINFFSTAFRYIMIINQSVNK